MVVLPKEYEIQQFVAIQHPANDMTSPVITTHYDFGSMHDVLVKLDVLGHDDPTMIRMLMDLTGIDARTLPLTDPDVISLFSGTEALGVTPEQIGSKTAHTACRNSVRSSSGRCWKKRTRRRWRN